LEEAPLQISATVVNRLGQHNVWLKTNGQEHTLAIAPKKDGLGSSTNGGELLFLALATCYCNDIYREAGKRGIAIDSVEVEVTGEFGGVGEAARKISYRASVAASAPEEEILSLMRHTDSVAEIHNTLRHSAPVVLSHCSARQV
jgi:organic hydroperoxide reductase OsmC/OhrA